MVEGVWMIVSGGGGELSSICHICHRTVEITMEELKSVQLDLFELKSLPYILEVGTHIFV